MQEILQKYLPEKAVVPCFELIKNYNIALKIVNERQTKHGDYQQLPNGQHKITINANLNKYRFLMTLIHEIAHLVTFLKYGNGVKPHGGEWKYTFQRLMLPFIRPDVFPKILLQPLVEHFQNPKASSDIDVKLSVTMRNFDTEENTKYYLFELPYGSYFRTDSGRVFVKKEQKIKRFKCLEINTGQYFVVQPHALVEYLPKK